MIWRICGRVALALAVAASILPAAFPADAAGNVRDEIHKAKVAASLAAEDNVIAFLRTNLQRALNCLIGPTGAGYDLNAGDPCRGLGNGAIVDISSAAKRAKLLKAADEARAGLKEKDLSAAQKRAGKVEHMLAGL